MRAELASFECSEVEAEVGLEIRSNGRAVDSHTETLSLPAKQTAIKEWRWTPQAFEADEYDVLVSIRRRGQTVSSAENGFVIWNDDVARRGPALQPQGKYFRIGGSESFLSYAL